MEELSESIEFVHHVRYLKKHFFGQHTNLEVAVGECCNQFNSNELYYLTDLSEMTSILELVEMPNIDLEEMKSVLGGLALEQGVEFLVDLKELVKLLDLILLDYFGQQFVSSLL